jgi:broad specificity phosphatase PhoE
MAEIAMNSELGGRVYVITHPEVIIDPDIPVPQWPLSARGRARMELMLHQPWVPGIQGVYCSTERKALDGARILARFLGLPCHQVADLREIDRSATGYLPSDEHRATAEQLFAHPDLSVRGWETARAAQARMVAAIGAIVGGVSERGDTAIVTHGGVAALYLCYLKGIKIDKGQEAPHPGGGCYYCFRQKPLSLVHGWKTIDGLRSDPFDK